MTRFRPCIDLRHGKVTQIVGGTLTGEGDAKVNFTSDHGPAFFAELYRRDNLTGGHVIMLGPGNEKAAREALAAWRGGLQIGGGINPGNALKWLEAGASHVIVTSYLFNEDAEFQMDRLERLARLVGRKRLVIDLSCRRQGKGWRVAMNRWQTLCDLHVNHSALDMLSGHCSEFLVHAADVEGRCEGIDTGLVRLLGAWKGDRPITYAGGAASLDDLQAVQDLSNGRVDLTIGSALDIFGGSGIRYSDCKSWNA